MCDDIQEIVHILTVVKTNMGLAQQPPHLLFDLRFWNTHHKHEPHKIVQHDRQEAVLILFQPLLFSITKGIVPEVRVEVRAIGKFN